MVSGGKRTQHIHSHTLHRRPHLILLQWGVGAPGRPLFGYAGTGGRRPPRPVDSLARKSRTKHQAPSPMSVAPGWRQGQPPYQFGHFFQPCRPLDSHLAVSHCTNPWGCVCRCSVPSSPPSPSLSLTLRLQAECVDELAEYGSAGQLGKAF